MKTSKSSEEHTAVFVTRGPAQTRKLGELLGTILTGTEIIHLHGGLGSGKTCFVQGLAGGLGVASSSPATSPSFTLINEYQGRLPLFHIDLYRVEDPGEIHGLGLEEYFDQGVVAVEWPEKLPRGLDDHLIDITLDVSSNLVRKVTLAIPERGPAYIVGKLKEIVPGDFLQSARR